MQAVLVHEPPVRPLCGPQSTAVVGAALAATPRQQPQEPLTHVTVHRVELARRVARSEVVAPAAKDRVDRRDTIADVSEARPATAAGQVVELGADGLHGPPRRPPEQVTASLEVGTHDPQVTAEEVEAVRPSSTSRVLVG